MRQAADSIVVPAPVLRLLRSVGQTADDFGLPAYAVGGCVRDWQLGVRQTPDLDVTVEGDGLRLAREAARRLRAEITEHPQFKTATLFVSGAKERRIDIATCRKETYSKPAAYPEVARGKLKDDLFRRDFSVNAMAACINAGRFGLLIDPFNGREDLSKGALRVLHSNSFRDDPSRILRGVRFLTRFGFKWEPDTRKSALGAIAAGLLGELNTGRLARELGTMFDEPNPKACFDELASLLDAAKKFR